jgi:hypothetical protein
MVEDTWTPWKMTAVGMMLVVATAVVTGLVVAGWGPRPDPLASSSSVSGDRAAPLGSVVPAQADVDTCNQFAKAQAGDKAIEVVKDGGAGPGKGVGNGGKVAPTAGTLYGLNETKKNDARYVEAYRACMKGRGFSS